MGKEGDEYSKENVRCCVEEVICNCEHPNVRDADYSGYPSTIIRVSVVRDRVGGQNPQKSHGENGCQGYLCALIHLKVPDESDGQ